MANKKFAEMTCDCGAPDGALHRAKCATSQSEPLVIPVEPDLELKIWDRPETLRITITPDLARRIVAMGQEESYL